MKTITVIAALLIVGISLNLSAQNPTESTRHFAAFKFERPAVSSSNSDNNNSLFLSGYQLEIAENKARKTFAALSDLGEDFYVLLAVKSDKDLGTIMFPQKQKPVGEKTQKVNETPLTDLRQNLDFDK